MIVKCTLALCTLALCTLMHFYTLADTGNPLSLLGLVCCVVSLGALYWEG